jgi:urease accessory protein
MATRMGMRTATIAATRIPTDDCRATRITATTMPERRSEATLLRLLTWMSPSFPVGSFAYSHGLERAIHGGLIHDRTTLTEWLRDLVQHGSGWNDAVLLADTWRMASEGDGGEAAALGEAMAGSRERHMETTLQGGAFSKAAAAWPHPHPSKADCERPYPVAIGVVASTHGLPLEPVLIAYLHGFSANLVQAAMRLVPLGQSDGVAAVAELEGSILDAAGRASRSTLDDLGSATLMSDIMAMQHETQYSRIFRS